ncbi:MAG: hypothetical protein AB7O67_23655 [Vicinamibacterales bacterium]
MNERDTTEPDALVEALAILDGTHPGPPTVAHLAALREAHAQTTLVMALLHRVVTALLIERRQPSVAVDGRMVRNIEARDLDIAVQRDPNGTITATLVRQSSMNPRYLN